MTFAQWIAETRSRKSLSQTECAKRAGVTQPTWRDYETVDRPKEKETVLKIADALEVARTEALEVAGFLSAPAEVSAEWARLWIETPVEKRPRLLKATRSVKEAIAA